MTSGDRLEGYAMVLLLVAAGVVLAARCWPRRADDAWARTGVAGGALLALSSLGDLALLLAYDVAGVEPVLRLTTNPVVAALSGTLHAIALLLVALAAVMGRSRRRTSVGVR